MPIDRRKELSQAEQDVQDFLSQRPGQIDKDIASTGAAVSASRAASGDTIKGAIQAAAQRYGLEPDTVTAAAPSIQRGQEDLESANQDALAMRRYRENQAKVNTAFNFVFNRLIQAGVDANSAKQTAMQFALDTQRRETSSAEYAKTRQVTLEKSDILDTFAQRRAELARKYAADRRKQAILNGVTRSFFGLVGTGIGFTAGGPAGAVVGQTAGTQVGDEIITHK